MRTTHQLIVNYQLLLKKYWGYDDFRGIQREIIESIGSGHDTLGLMPTGGGKSITFQVPAMAMEGVCIVITPLVALMKDQIYHLWQKGIKAACIHAAMSHNEIVTTLENAIFGGVKFLYVSPERLSTELFQAKLRHMKVCFICVDEAHCICQWGYDFRPSYLEIANIRKLLPQTPLLALTATATPEVVNDICDKLRMTDDDLAPCNSNSGIRNSFRVFRMSFERKNLIYVVRRTDDKMQQLIHILSHVEGAAIVYVRSRERTKDTAEALCKAGLSATFFHAGLDSSQKDERQKAWLLGNTRIIVATNAFGMGIDKPDVRLVIHIDCPDSIEAYFQEAGRAGRDGRKAYAVLLYNHSDAAKLTKRINDQYPPKQFIKDIYDQLAYFYQIGVGAGYGCIFEFPMQRFCSAYKRFPIQVESALHILTRAGYIEYREEEECKARVMFTLERDDLYRLKGNDAQEDAVIVALLRNYTGLFNGFCYIDESILSLQTGLTLPQIYLTLKSLHAKHILQFIPQKKTPYVHYTQRREQSEHIIIPPQVYDDLKERFAQRIQQMIRYASTSDRCRSEMLLSYFGETDTHPCNQCDVCLEQKEDKEKNERIQLAQQAILDLLSDKVPHPISVIHSIPMDYTPLEEALRRLVNENIIYTTDDGCLCLTS